MGLLNDNELADFNEFLMKKYGTSPDGSHNSKFEAITTFNKNILLSAGAGCGKTTTLSLRVLYGILVKDLSVSDMLILTFTNNAAREMKDRIKDDLKEFATKKEKYPFINEEASKKLLDEAEKVDSAQISTFDSFSNAIVRKYADRLGVSPTFTILDQTVNDYMFYKAEDEKINEEFNNPNSKIRSFFDRDVSTNSGLLKSMIASLEKMRQTESNAEDIFDNWKENYLSNQEEIQNNATLYCLNYFVEYMMALGAVLDQFRLDYVDVQANDEENSATFFERAAVKIRKIGKKYYYLECQDYYSEVQNMIHDMENISFQGKKSGPKEIFRPMDRSWWKNEVVSQYEGDDQKLELLEKQKKCIKESYDNIKNSLIKILPTETSVALMDKNAEYIDYAIELNKKIHQIVQEQKKEHNAYTFFDVSYMCLKLLKENSDIREEEKNRIKTIMVDEYQDSNNSQEELLMLLGTDEEQLLAMGDDNKVFTVNFVENKFNRNITFMVGDVKQSIYGFRNAKPDLFMSKYRNPEDNNFELLTMTDNYRSDSQVVDEVNSFFTSNMTLQVGGVDYANDINQQIKASNKTLNQISSTDFNDLGSYDYDFEDKELPAKITNGQLKKHIIAFDIAKKIKSWVESKKVIVTEKRDGSRRPAEYRDFAILVRAKNQANPYVKAFSSLNIPCTLDIDQDFKMNTATMVLENLVKLEYYLTEMKSGRKLTNDELDSYKHCIASVERSFLLNVKDIQIIEDVKNCLSLDEAKRPLVLKMLDEVNVPGESEIKSPNQIIKEIFSKFDVYYKISTLNNPDEILSSYNFFIGEIDNLSSMGFSYNEFIEYFKELREGNLFDTPQELKLYKARGNSILITTIHKSKGMEYPFVIVPMSNKGPKSKEENGSLIFDEKYGFIPSFTKADRDFIREQCPRDNSKKDKNGEGKIWNPDKKNEFNFVIPQLLAHELQKEKDDLSEHLRLVYVALTRARLANVMVFSNSITMKSRLYYSTRLQPKSFEDFGARASHSFMRLQHGDCVHYSMEDIISDVDKSNIPYKQELLDSNSFSIRLCDPLPDSVTRNKLNNFARASKADSVFADKDNEKFGTKLHLELENLDWSNYPTLPKSDFIKNEREKMLIDKFIRSDFISNLVGRHPQFYQEFEFIDPVSHHEGSIDLAIVTDDTSYVIDYKTSSTADLAYRRQVSIYRKNLAELLNIDIHKIECYLYSIIEGKFVKVDVDDVK